MEYHQIQIRVRYSETDQMRVVYHGNYAQYFEMGRVEWLRNLGVSYKWMEDNGVMLPVVSLEMNSYLIMRKVITNLHLRTYIALHP